MAGFDLRGGKPGNYVLGRGKLYLSGDSNKTTGLGTGPVAANTQKVFRDVGNVTAFTVNQESEVKEHKSSLSGLQVIDLEVPVSQKMSISFSCDELNANNITRFLSGTYIGRDNDAGSAGLANGAAIASDNALITAGFRNFFVDTATTDHVHDVWYDILLDLVVPAAGFDLRGVPCVDFEPNDGPTVKQAITVTKGGADNVTPGTALTEGVHYEIDRQMGRIRFYNVAGGLAAGDTFLVVWAAPSVAKASTPGLDDSLWVIQPLTTSGVTVGLVFVMENANDGSIPTRFEYWQVKLKPDGDLAGIGDDWAAMSFTGVVEAVTEYPIYGSKYGRVLGRNSFTTFP